MNDLGMPSCGTPRSFNNPFVLRSELFSAEGDRRYVPSKTKSRLEIMG